MKSSYLPSPEPENIDSKSRTDWVEVILKHLENKDTGKVILYGKRGVGKTWIAQEVTKQTTIKNICDVTIWVYNENINCSSVLHQISAQEKDLAVVDYHVDYDPVDRDFLIESLKQKVQGRKCLLVLDDDDNPMELEVILENADKSSKVLVTCLEGNDRITRSCRYTDGHAEAIEIKPMTLSEAKDLMRRSWSDDQTKNLCDDDVEDIVKRCKYLPADIVFTGNILLYALENSGHDWDRELVVREAKKEVDEYWRLGCCSGFDKFSINATVLRCFWLSYKYLNGHRSMNYNKLILFWMLDGCFDSTTSSENAYAHAHSILIDFIDAGLLSLRQVGDVVLERAGLGFADYLFEMTYGKFQFEKSSKFYNFLYRGSIKRMDGITAVFTKSGDGSSEKVNLVTLFLNKRNNMSSNVDQFNIHDPNVTESIRILFASHVKLIISLQEMCPLLSILILRDCDINQISDTSNLTQLMVLEISECTSLKNVTQDFLANFELLESLNLSDVPMKHFPRPSFGLSNLRSLFLRRCTQLESFPDVNGLGQLRVLDLSGSKFTLSKNEVWELEELPELRVLDMSETNISKCPNLEKLENLSYVLLKNCPLLTKLSSLTSLTELKVIEASGSNKLDDFVELNDHCLIHKLDLSSTKLSKIPPLKNASKLVHLLLKDCSELKALPPIEGAKNLRILDVSGCIQLEEINASFEEMNSLQELLLSNTNITTLPSLLGLQSLRRIALEGCKALQSLPKLDSLTNLLLLDIRGCIALATLSDEHLSHVKVLKDDTA